METLLLNIYSAVLPTILQAIAAVLGLLLIRATTYASTRWNIEIEARHREALHSAIMSGIASALSKGLTGKAALEAALAYTTKSVPDALHALNPSAEVLLSLAEAKLREAVPLVGAGWPGVSMAEAAGVQFPPTTVLR